MKAGLLRLLDLFWLAVPTRIKVHFIQNRGNYGFLDTSKKRIRMRLESIDTLNRMNSCQKEPETIRWLENNVKENEVLFDIGANVGAYSLYAASIIGAKVYSFEPSPSTFRLLLENIHLNNLSKQITPFNIPLSSSGEMKEFIYSNLDAGSASHAGLEKSPDADAIRQPVFTVTLDDLIQKHNVETPHHMKIDVDGHELGILRGAKNLLQSSTLKTIQVELSKTDADYETIVKIFQSAGFKVGHINQHPHSQNTDIVFVK